MGSIKKSILFFLFLVSIAALAYATTWHERFVSNYEKLGIDKAVEIAVSEGGDPDGIIKKALPIEGIDRKVLIKALFCNITKPEVVQNAALKNKISEKTIWDGYQIAITECRRQLEEWYNYIPPGRRPPPGNASPSQYDPNEPLK
jgi:hypothetical protein